MPRPADRHDHPPLGPAIVTQLHLWLAIAAGLLAVLVGLEAGWRAWQSSPPGTASDRLETLLLVVVVVAIGGGIGLLVGGARPRELLHFVYAIVLLGALPIAVSVSKGASPRARAIALLTGALVALVVLARLFSTG